MLEEYPPLLYANSFAGASMNIANVELMYCAIHRANMAALITTYLSIQESYLQARKHERLKIEGYLPSEPVLQTDVHAVGESAASL